MRWSFYYDEAFHDRKIKLTKSDRINIYSENSGDVFVGVFIGVNTKDEACLLKKYKAFEVFQKSIFGLKADQELKGTTISKNNFKHGIASFNRNCLSFYDQFFSIIDDKVVVHISLLSKTSMIFEKLFENVEL